MYSALLQGVFFGQPVGMLKLAGTIEVCHITVVAGSIPYLRLQKPEKVYLSYSNRQFTLHRSRPDTGTLRESFFLSQVQPLHKVEYRDKGDFKLNRKVAVE